MISDVLDDFGGILNVSIMQQLEGDPFLTDDFKRILTMIDGRISKLPVFYMINLLDIINGIKIYLSFLQYEKLVWWFSDNQ